MSENSQNKDKKFRVNAIGLIFAGLIAVPGLLLGQILGVTMAFSYTPYITLLSAFSFGGFSYLINRKKQLTSSNFFKRVSVGLALALGAVWGGLILPPLFYYTAIFFATNLSILIGISLGAAVFGGITWLSLKFLKNVSTRPLSIIASAFIGMVLVGCLGLAWGPLGYMLALNIGVVVGLGAGVINSFVNKMPVAAKVLSSLYAISGILIGVMTGALVSAAVPALSSAIISAFFGITMMIGGTLMGNVIGSKYKGLDLKNKQLRHKIYQAAFLIPTIFAGYLLGGFVGLKFFPLNQILQAQALGIVAVSSLYGLALSAFYVIKDIIFKPKKDEVNTSDKVVDLAAKKAAKKEIKADTKDHKKEHKKDQGVKKVFGSMHRSKEKAGKDKKSAPGADTSSNRRRAG